MVNHPWLGCRIVLGAACAVKVRGGPGAGIIAEVKGPTSTNVT